MLQKLEAHDAISRVGEKPVRNPRPPDIPCFLFLRRVLMSGDPSLRVIIIASLIHSGRDDVRLEGGQHQVA